MKKSCRECKLFDPVGKDKEIGYCSLTGKACTFLTQACSEFSNGKSETPEQHRKWELNRAGTKEQAMLSLLIVLTFLNLGCESAKRIWNHEVANTIKTEVHEELVTVLPLMVEDQVEMQIGGILLKEMTNFAWLVLKWSLGPAGVAGVIGFLWARVRGKNRWC